jgi:hypothetical protein
VTRGAEVVKPADDLTDEENWTGGFYELSLVLGGADDDKLDRAVRALWRAAGVTGCRADRADGSGPWRSSRVRPPCTSTVTSEGR